MFGPKELDLRNTYNPDLNNIEESAKRTYGEANSFYRKEEIYLKDVESRIISGELSSKESIYDECHAIASDLAKCCEMYLKALFLYENLGSGKSCEELWKILEAKSKPDDKNMKDKNGNVIYYQTEKDNVTPLKHPDGSIIYVYAKVDSDGNIVNGIDGKPLYVDKLGRDYNYNRKGRAVKTNGHALDRLIELISTESRLLLETRMLTIPMESTEKNGVISILDVLQKKGLLSSTQHISQEQYMGWLDQHKRTFEESRFSGQKEYDVNVEFLYHLATQIKAVVQYKMNPMDNQKFTITDQELSKLPIEIQQLASFDSKILSEKLIKLIASDEKSKDKIISLIANNCINYLKGINSNNFYQIISKFDLNEIAYISYLNYIILNYNKLNFTVNNENEQVRENTKIAFIVASIFKTTNFSINQIVGLCIQIKTSLKRKIDGKVFIELFDALKLNKLYDLYSKKIYVDKINYFNNLKYPPDYNLINNKIYK